MLNKLKKYASHPAVAFGGGVIIGLALATTVMGAAASAKIANLRQKAGV